MESICHDAFIEQARNKVQKTESLMDCAQADYIEAVKEFLPLWNEEYVKHVRRKERELSISKGPEGARQLKDALCRLNASVPDLVQAELEKEDYWDHRKRADNSGKHALEFRQHPFIRKLLGHVAILLGEHGYLNESDDGDWYSNSHQHLPRYKNTIQVNNELEYYFREYLNLAHRLHNEMKEAESLTAEKERVEIDDMWHDD